MKRIYQTRFGEPDGNCLEACIASIFELDEIPWFGRRSNWYDNYQDFVAQFGLQVLTIEIEPVKDLWTPTGYHIVSGIGERGIAHSIVGRAGRPFHDPFPGGGFLAKEQNWDVFVARDPLMVRRAMKESWAAGKPAVYKEFRKDGWPLCPNCGEDELWCPGSTQFYADNGRSPNLRECLTLGLACYSCQSQFAPAG